ncbi:MAG: hypothetical protein WDO74_08455 [Pseudomonadota bacterium]
MTFNTQAALPGESCNLSSITCADFEACEHVGGDRVSCSGDVATVCSSGSQFKYNCGSVGLACSTTAKSEYCLAPGCNAADVDFVCHESCSDDGSSLTFCYGGLPYTVACEAYGFTHCSSGIDRASGRTFAACRFQPAF